MLSCVQLFCNCMDCVACQVPLSMGFPRQQYWSGMPFPSLGDLPDPGIEPMSSALAGGFFTTEPPGKPHSFLNFISLFKSPQVLFAKSLLAVSRGFPLTMKSLRTGGLSLSLGEPSVSTLQWGEDSGPLCPSDAAIASHCHKVSLLNMAWYNLALMFFLPARYIDATLLERCSILGLLRP